MDTYEGGGKLDILMQTYLFRPHVRLLNKCRNAEQEISERHNRKH